MRSIHEFLGSPKVDILDIGANPIDGDPPYKRLLQAGNARVIGFEPQPDALERLEAMKGPNEVYFPHAVGRGERCTFYACYASGMSSTLRPNAELLSLFQGYPTWSQVTKTWEIDTVPLDAIDEIQNIDMLKMDVQGGEAAVIDGGMEKIRNAVLVHTEANFIPLYENQALFGDLDAKLRDLGFLFHRFVDMRIRLFAPIVVDNQINKGISQITTADAVYVSDPTRLKGLPSQKLLSLAMLLHEIYKSFDLVQLVLKEHDSQFGSNYWDPYLAIIQGRSS